MKNHLFSAIIAGFICSFGFAQTQASASKLKQQQKDFAVFKKSLFTIEARLDRCVSMDSIQKVVAAAEKAFNETDLTAIEEFKWYATCINLVQSGHTQVQPSRDVLKEYVLKQKSLPFDMIMVNKKLYVAGYEKPGKKSSSSSRKKTTDLLPEGAEIVGIDGKTITQWMKEIGQFIGSDEDDKAFEYFVAGQLFDFYRFLATETHKEKLTVHYIVKRDTLEQSVTLGFPPIKRLSERFDKQEAQLKKDKKSQGTFKFIGSDVAYFRFPSFYDNHGHTYSQFLEKSFTKIKKKKKVKTVIIDVRGNGGGHVQTELISYFIQPTEGPELVGNYQIVKRLKRKQLKNIVKSKAEYRNYRRNIRRFKRIERKFPEFKGQLYTYNVDTSLIYKGNVIVLTDEGTFSAASLLAAQLKTHREAKIMGSRPGGTYYECNAGTLTLRIPNSKILVILNPNTCASTLTGSKVDPAVKNVDVEIVPDYDPKASAYKKNWEEVIKIALRKAD